MRFTSKNALVQTFLEYVVLKNNKLLSKKVQFKNLINDSLNINRCFQFKYLLSKQRLIANLIITANYLAVSFHWLIYSVYQKSGDSKKKPYFLTI